jgi:hypothetical protein
MAYRGECRDKITYILFSSNDVQQTMCTIIVQNMNSILVDEEN